MSGVMPSATHEVVAVRAASGLSSAATMSSTRSAPAARASNTWYGVAMKSLRSTGSADRSANRLEVGERSAEPATLGEHADRARAAELIAAGECGRVGDLARARRVTGSIA